MAIEVAPVAMNPMIQSTKLGGISPGEPMAPGGATPTEPSPESVAEFDRQMSQPMLGSAPAQGADSTPAPAAGSAPASGGGDSTGASAVENYVKLMKESMGEAAFKAARDQAFPTMTGTEKQKDEVFGAFMLTTVNMANEQMSKDRQQLEENLRS
jgi:hypothetical protein